MTLPRQKPVVGQVVYQIPRRSAYGIKKLIPMVVTSVGRKYFCWGSIDSQEYSSDTEYHIDDWSERTRYTPDTYLYASVQEYEEVREAFRGYSTEGLSLEQLRAIKQIIEGGRNKE